MKTLFFASVLPLLFAFAACSDNTNPAVGDDDDDGTSSGEESSSGETSSSGSGPSSSSGGSSGASTSSGGSSGPFACPSGTTETTVRIATGNISNGNAQSYDDGTGLRIFKALTPDIALVQEMNYLSNSSTDLQAFADGFGEGYSYYRAGPIDAAIPNGIVSKYPLLASGEGVDDHTGGTRNFAWARLDVPGDQDVLAVSVHLATDGPKREDEVPQLLSMIAGVYHDGDLLVLGGDFNTDTRTDAGMSKIATRFVTSGPYPADEDGNDGTNTNRNEHRDSGGDSKGKPYDWLIGDSATAARARTTNVGPLAFPAGLVFDSRVFSDLSLVPGVLATDSENHQHMAVVRTFAVCQ